MFSQPNDSMNNPFDPAEPARDEQLGALLRRAEGAVPVASVNWDELALRISRALPPRMSTCWWSYAARWERRMLPIALAASLAGALALWSSSSEPVTTAVARADTSEMVADVVQGTPAEDVARTFARSVTNEDALGDTVPE